MANEGSSKGFAKVFHKKVHRTKEKVLHSLGKADRTADVIFDEHVHNFQQQQAVAAKLQKELKNYIGCVKAMQNASTNFYTTVREIWEIEWTGHAEMRSALEQLSFVWEAHLERLNTEVQTPLSIYLAHFPELRSKISKRGRKLVDFDSARHNLQNMENAKKRDEGKIAKAQEDLQDAENIYTAINVELHNDLPSFYEGRINNLASSLNSFFNVESKFQEESAKIKTAMAKTSDDLQREYHNGILSTPQIAKSLRNGNVDADDDTVDLSRNELSPMATRLGRGYEEEESPVDSRGGGRRYSDKNSYRRSSSASQSSASDRGPQTPVSQTRGSVPSVTGARDTGGEDSSKDNSLVRKGKQKLSESEEAAYEDFNYDDGSYEAVNVRGQFHKLDFGLNFGDFHGGEQAMHYGIYGQYPSSIYIEGASVGESSDTGSPEKQSNSANENTTEKPVPPPPKPQLKLDEEEENEEIEDDEQVYNVPKSNEPVNNNIPEGVKVLYKHTNNALWDASPTSASNDAVSKSGVKVAQVGSEVKGSASNDLVPGQMESLYEQERVDFSDQTSEVSWGNADASKSGSMMLDGYVDGGKRVGTLDAPEKSPLVFNGDGASVPPKVPKRDLSTFASTSSSSSTRPTGPDNMLTNSHEAKGTVPTEVSKKDLPGTAASSSTTSEPPRGSQIERMLSRSREDIQTPSLIAAEQEVEAIFSRADDWNSNPGGVVGSGKPKNTKPPRTHIKQHSGSGKSLVEEEMKNKLNPEDAAALASFAKLESVFDQIDPFGSPQDDIFPNGGQTPVQKDPFAGEDPFANETPSPVFVGEYAVDGDQSSSLFDDAFDPSPFGATGLYKSKDPFLPQDVPLESFDPLADSQFENSFTDPVKYTSTTAADNNSNSRHQNLTFAMPDTSATTNVQTEAVPSLGTSTRIEVPTQEPKRYPEVQITVSVADDSIAEGEITGPIRDSDPMLPESTGNADPRFTGHDGKEETEVVQEERAYDTPVAGWNVLYRVIATHNYTGEDTDELNFESGEVVCVIPFEDPDDQDDGWLYGIKEIDGERGMFPANFTRRL